VVSDRLFGCDVGGCSTVLLEASWERKISRASRGRLVWTRLRKDKQTNREEEQKEGMGDQRDGGGQKKKKTIGEDSKVTIV